MRIYATGLQEKHIPLLEALGRYTEVVVSDLLEIPKGSIVLWFDPRVPTVKQQDHTALLVLGLENARATANILDYGLSVKANLIVHYDLGTNNVWLLDPLGNYYCPTTLDINFLAYRLVQRLRQLKAFTREGSVCVGDDPIEPPDDTEFFALAQEMAIRFDSIIPQPKKRVRPTGNASFRCQRGFPGFRGPKGHIFVSRRNVDKAHIDKHDFVAVNPYSEQSKSGSVFYHGPHKPSVDTPVQLRLFNALPNVHYIIHGHTYVEGGATTNGLIPCGAVEEVEEILSMDPNRTWGTAAINLRGHGCILFASAGNVGFIRDIKLIPRPFPEPA